MTNLLAKMSQSPSLGDCAGSQNCARKEGLGIQRRPPPKMVGGSATPLMC